MPGDTERQRQVADEVPRREDGDDGPRDDQVRDDHPTGPAGECEEGGQAGQVVADQDDVGGLQGESSVACLAELVGAAPTAVSQHLAKLRLAGLVRGRREGTFVFYSAADEHVRELLAEALRHADHAERGAARS